MHINFGKRKVWQAASGKCVQKWLFCKTYFLYNICFFICVHTEYRPFSRKIHFHMENFLNGYFYCSSFTENLLNRYFQELQFVAGERKIVGARNCLSEIMSLRAIISHKTDFAIFTVLPCVTSWAICLTDKYLWETSPNKLRVNIRLPQPVNRSFLWH